MNRPSRLSKNFEGFIKRRAEFNVLYPTERVFEIPQAFKLVPEVLRINPDPAKGEVWSIGERQNELGVNTEMFALTYRSLQKIAQTAEIIFDPRYTRRTDGGLNPRRAEYTATGMLRKPDGQWINVTQTKEIDLDVIQSEVQNQIEQDAAMQGGLNVSRNGMEQLLALGTSDFTREVSRRVSAKMLFWRKNIVLVALAGAHKRVIRSLLLIKDLYTAEELERPFVIPRVSLDTDYLLNDLQLNQSVRNAYLEVTLGLLGPERIPGVSLRKVAKTLHVTIHPSPDVPKANREENEAPTNGNGQTGGPQ